METEPRKGLPADHPSMKAMMHVAASSSSALQGIAIGSLSSDLAGPFDLEAAAGESIVITGQSGSGKSLFLRMLADLDVNEGHVSLDGRDRRSFTPPLWRSLVTYVAAESGWWFDTVKEHFSAEHIGDAAVFAERLGLSRAMLSAPVSQLSSGERQRWALIRAVVRKPRVLLLDEPTGALDQLSVERVERFLHCLLDEGTIVLLVTHDVALGIRMGGRRFEMVDRQLRAV